MQARKEGILPGIFLMIMNTWAAILRGPLLWQAWSDLPWARTGLLLLSGVLASTLMNVWSLILRFPVLVIEQGAIPSVDEPEAADV